MTFETEQAQRRCLRTLTRGIVPAAFDWREGMDDNHLFKGSNVLDVKEAPEVNEVRAAPISCASSMDPSSEYGGGAALECPSQSSKWVA